MKKQKQRSENGARKTDRTSIILSMFREFPNNKFSLKHLASASGGATKEGRRETLEILGRLFEEGVVEECAREKYRLMQTHLPHYEGVADMAPSGSVYVKVEGQESDIFVNQRNAANALNGDRVEVVVMHRGRNGQLEGEITRIIERNRKPYVGVAEVGARFTLDAMPGKQMAIDADLSSGLIDEKEARLRRYKIQKEADFYGAMDGATKIVKGDAVMSLIITVINFVAGLIIGGEVVKDLVGFVPMKG